MKFPQMSPKSFYYSASWLLWAIGGFTFYKSLYDSYLLIANVGMAAWFGVSSFFLYVKYLEVK